LVDPDGTKELDKWVATTKTAVERLYHPSVSFLFPSLLNPFSVLTQFMYNDKNGQKVFLIAHSLGNMMALYLLDKERNWSKNFVAGFISGIFPLASYPISSFPFPVSHFPFVSRSFPVRFPFVSHSLPIHFPVISCFPSLSPNYYCSVAPPFDGAGLVIKALVSFGMLSNFCLFVCFLFTLIRYMELSLRRLSLHLLPFCTSTPLFLGCFRI
jgi:Lecithin:cholesterol acyltransferase